MRRAIWTAAPLQPGLAAAKQGDQSAEPGRAAGVETDWRGPARTLGGGDGIADRSIVLIECDGPGSGASVAPVGPRRCTWADEMPGPGGNRAPAAPWAIAPEATDRRSAPAPALRQLAEAD